MPGTYSKLLYHIVFSTKHRAQSIPANLQPRLHECLGGIIRSERGVPHDIGGTADHVHVLLGWRTDEALSALMQNLKSSSTRWLHRDFPQMASFAWQEGFAAFTVSESQFAAVRTYIQNQPRHHHQRSFEQELRDLLDAHGVEYDDRYLLG